MALFEWFLDKDNRYVRSVTCLICMVVCAVAIWWLYNIPCETWTDLAVDAVMVVVAIVFIYIFKRRKWM